MAITVHTESVLVLTKIQKEKYAILHVLSKKLGRIMGILPRRLLHHSLTLRPLTIISSTIALQHENSHSNHVRSLIFRNIDIVDSFEYIDPLHDKQRARMLYLFIHILQHCIPLNHFDYLQSSELNNSLYVLVGKYRNYLEHLEKSPYGGAQNHKAFQLKSKLKRYTNVLVYLAFRIQVVSLAGFGQQIEFHAKAMLEYQKILKQFYKTLVKQESLLNIRISKEASFILKRLLTKFLTCNIENVAQQLKIVVNKAIQFLDETGSNITDCENALNCHDIKDSSIISQNIIDSSISIENNTMLQCIRENIHNMYYLIETQALTESQMNELNITINNATDDALLAILLHNIINIDNVNSYSNAITEEIFKILGLLS